MTVLVEGSYNCTCQEGSYDYKLKGFMTVQVEGNMTVQVEGTMTTS